MVLLHMICSLLSYGAFLIALVAAVLFLVQERQLKRKRMGRLFHSLPPLNTLDRINFVAIGAGFTLLTAGLLFGIWGAYAYRGRWWSGDPKETLTGLLWLSYCVVWLVRVRATLRGRKIAMLSILGFGLVIFTLVGAGWLMPTWHSYL